MTSAEYIFVVYIKTLYTICYHLYNLKNVKNTQGGVAKSNTPLWVFSKFLKLYKWYQIAQSITYIIFSREHYRNFYLLKYQQTHHVIPC